MVRQIIERTLRGGGEEFFCKSESDNLEKVPIDKTYEEINEFIYEMYFPNTRYSTRLYTAVILNTSIAVAFVSCHTFRLRSCSVG